MKIIGNPGALKPVISKLFNIRLSMTCADLERVFKFCKMFKALIIFGIDIVPPNMYFHCHLKESDFVAVHKF